MDILSRKREAPFEGHISNPSLQMRRLMAEELAKVENKRDEI